MVFGKVFQTIQHPNLSGQSTILLLALLKYELPQQVGSYRTTLGDWHGAHL
jgi:hypothetical protein